MRNERPAPASLRPPRGAARRWLVLPLLALLLVPAGCPGGGSAPGADVTSPRDTAADDHVAPDVLRDIQDIGVDAPPPRDLPADVPDTPGDVPVDDVPVDDVCVDGCPDVPTCTQASCEAAIATEPCQRVTCNPETGACVVYAWRPICCRTYGPSVRIGGDDLPPCPLCFKGASSEAIEAARRTIDVDDQETPLTTQVETRTGRRGMTTVAFAIGDVP